MKAKFLLGATLVMALAIGTVNASPMTSAVNKTTTEQGTNNQVKKHRRYHKKHHRHHVIKHRSGAPKKM